MCYSKNFIKLLYIEVLYSFNYLSTNTVLTVYAKHKKERNEN